MNTMHLKLLALTTMILDHVGAIFFPGAPYLRTLGRLAFPIYCFLLIEGYLHTRDVKKYIGRLFLFALLSELPFDLAFFGTFTLYHQNIFFTLALGLLAVSIFDTYKDRLMLLSASALFGALFFAELLRMDYGSLGILYIFSFYLFRLHRQPEKTLYTGGLLTLSTYLYSSTRQLFAVAALLPLFLYNGEKGPHSPLLKYGFYAAYPLHLLLLYLLQIL